MSIGVVILRVFAVTAAVLSMSCHRLADEPGEPIDFEALKIDACESVCATMDTCEPDRFAGQEPEDCFERCMTLLPRLHEETQCGSREMIWMHCIGELDCVEFEAYEVADMPGARDHEVRCVTEAHRSIYCDEDGPFDLDEPVPSHP